VLEHLCSKHEAWSSNLVSPKKKKKLKNKVNEGTDLSTSKAPCKSLGFPALVFSYYFTKELEKKIPKNETTCSFLLNSTPHLAPLTTFLKSDLTIV
jgi:hypothetical protein